jgi:predicted translin family RNA/ssDNA-binding protein
MEIKEQEAELQKLKTEDQLKRMSECTAELKSILDKYNCALVTVTTSAGKESYSEVQVRALD